jgi:8-oxo-dGDP phosphatase
LPSNSSSRPAHARDLGRAVLGERTLYHNPWVRLVKVDVQPPHGEHFEHHVVRLERVVIAAVVDESDRVRMLWRHRFVTDEWGWELPGGIVDVGEEGAATPALEVGEKTGWRPAR